MTPLLARRHERPFERLYQRHVGDVYRYALVVLRNPQDAEDVTQTTFLNAYRAFERGERPRKPLNWLMTIAHNVCRQRFRQASRRPQEVELHEEAVGGLVADDATPTGEDIRRALGHLAFNQRAALVMREIEGRSYAEIAEILALSVGAVETLIFRARQALREQLEGSLTCHEAERAISRQLDGRLSRSEKGMLRAHLRACAECAGYARSQRGQRAAIRSLAFIPVPEALQFFSGGGATAAAGGATAAAGGAAATIAVKAAAVSATALLAGGVATGGVDPAKWRDDETRVERAAAASKQLSTAPAIAVRLGRAGVAGGALSGSPTRPAKAPKALRKAVAPRVAKIAKGRGRGAHSRPEKLAKKLERLAKLTGPHWARQVGGTPQARRNVTRRQRTKPTRVAVPNPARRAVPRARRPAPPRPAPAPVAGPKPPKPPKEDQPLSDSLPAG